MVNEPAEVDEAEFPIFSGEENEGVPAFIDQRWRRVRSTSSMCPAQIEKPKGVFEKFLGGLFGNLEVFFESFHYPRMLVGQNRLQRRR
jgi:hypothetical protein